MSSYRFPRDDLRQALLAALPAVQAELGDRLLDLRFLHIPKAHTRALHPDQMLVTGIRGAGKTLWWRALQEPAYRRQVESVLPRTDLHRAERVAPGFGLQPDPDRYPDRDSLSLLLRVHPARIVWRTVVLWNVGSELTDLPLLRWWRERVGWVADHPEEAAALLAQADGELALRGTRSLVLFDALDQTATDWDTLSNVLRGLLQALLEFRAFRGIRAKAFVRPDMLDSETLAFPDASKLLMDRVDLRWPRSELFGLLWQYLGNANQGGDAFREGCAAGFGQAWTQQDNIWVPPEPLREDEALQRRVFHAIAGPWMGRDRRRGFPYTWLPNHLADAHGYTSPRSFLAALRAAVDDSRVRTTEYALHYESIKRGVQKASQVRVQEIEEDHPLVATAREPLAGVVVPCKPRTFVDRWRRAGTLQRLEGDASDGLRPVPRRVLLGHDRLLEELGKLGVLSTMGDGRIQMPDVYRVGFGMGRRGGVRPVR